MLIFYLSERYTNYNTVLTFKDRNAAIINKIISDMNTIDDETLSVRIVYFILFFFYIQQYVPLK